MQTKSTFQKSNQSTTAQPQSKRYHIHPKYKSKLKRSLVLIHIFLIALLVVFINSCNTGAKIPKTKGHNNDDHKSGVMVEICEKLPPKDSSCPKKNIYLTFDDGPNKGTMNVFTMLEEKALPATFFVIGSHIFGTKKQTEVFNTLRNASFCEVANHTFYHAHNRYKSFYKDTDKVLYDFKLMSDTLGLVKNIARTPANNSWRTCSINYDSNEKISKAVDTLFAHDYKVIGWDVEWKIGRDKLLTKSAIDLVNDIHKGFEENTTLTENEMVILLHDQHFVHTENSKQLNELLGLLSSDSQYEFKKISDYPDL